jgi:restriction system protein
MTQAEGAQFLRYFGPLLEALKKLGGSAAPAEAVDQIARDLALSDKVQSEVLPSGGARFPNQVAWARFYLSREGLLDTSKRGIWSLTKKGLETSVTDREARDIFRKWVKIFAEERKKRKAEEAGPEDQVPGAGDLPQVAHRADLLSLLLALPPEGFERLCQALLREAGFVQVVVTGRSGDGGIDGYGTLQVNQLVSFKVLFQCKRYSNAVPVSQVRDFRGAMQGRADKGIIITTGAFTADARTEAVRDGAPPVELVDGDKLIKMCEELEFGLRPVKTFEVDRPFLEEFQKKVNGRVDS